MHGRGFHWTEAQTLRARKRDRLPCACRDHRRSADRQALAPERVLAPAGGRSDTNRVQVVDVVGRENCAVCESW
jgi:hypothetical protein